MMDEKNYGSYQQDTAWRDVPPQENYQRGYEQQAGNWSQTGDFSWQQRRQHAGKGFGIASLVLGILALVLFFTFLNIPLAILAIVFGVIHISRRSGSAGLGIAGIVTSVFSVLLTIAMVLFLVFFGFQMLSSSELLTLPFEYFVDELGDYEYQMPENDPWKHGHSDDYHELCQPEQNQIPHQDLRAQLEL